MTSCPLCRKSAVEAMAKWRYKSPADKDWSLSELHEDWDRFLAIKPTRDEFIQATHGVVLSSRILYDLTLGRK